eukprot:CAMPEP_0114591410 /NCGR_PEP_ID=MMETSP0125-20121206/13458_1 /TAXON_ID=485358 ORGANISM="Aristerostoma sp., Strain ATCC 50986" /NCGR_SAMPLE_ID=MMETSP0125 /ASSEMBLY_ACC=CAM_ASM_000245 /LENGTH=108 /DNA_ID=CAMNT_0001789469 /DNA_START=229 /DNA_END=555 /DNA_ORIENTATION=+
MIWDTAGSERYLSITTAHYRKSKGAMIFFDLTDRNSFENTVKWLDRVYEHTSDEVDLKLDREVTTQEAEKLAEKYNMIYYETSAKTGHNVKESFMDLTERIYRVQSEL